MHSSTSKIVVLALAASLTLAFQAALEAVDVQIDFDKAVDFKPLRSWAWDLSNSDVVMARTQEDDAKAMRVRAEPIILDAVATEMARLGLQRVESQPVLASLAFFGVLPVTSEAVFGQDEADVAIEINRLAGLVGGPGCPRKE